MNWFAKMTFDGGGKQKASASDSSRNYISITVCREIKKQNGPTANYFRKLAEKLSLHSNNTGSILIEFAVCMPVLIILLFYINDLSKLKRYYDQTEFVAQQFVNIIQNISQKRTNKKITLIDIKYAATLAYLSIYPGTTMYRIGESGSKHKLSHAPRLNIHYIKALSEGKASCTWCIRFLGEGASNPLGWSPSIKASISSTLTSPALSSICLSPEATPSSIYPTLKMEEKDKIIVEVNLFNAAHVMNPNDYVEGDKQETLAKKAFKCLLATPRPLVRNINSTQGWYFDSVVIFTPHGGLFDPDNPPA